MPFTKNTRASMSLLLMGGLALMITAPSMASETAMAKSQASSAAASRAPGDLPPTLRRWSEKLSYAGNVGGLESWTVSGGADLIMLAPDRSTIFYGQVFGPRGQDIGAAYTGKPPRPLGEALSASVSPAAMQAGTSDSGSGADEAGSGITSGRTGMADPEAATEPETRILSLAEEEEQAVEADSSLPAIFRAAEESGQEPKTPEPPAPSATPPVASGASPANANTQAETEQAAGFASVEEDAFWMIVGNSAAPAVYVFLDPTCPFCGQAMSTLQEAVESGRIHLRVILTPFRSREALGLAAAILTDKEPPVAFWRHEIEKGLYQRNGIEAAPAEKLGRKGLQLLERNVLMMRDLKIPGVPFFLHKEGEAWLPNFGVTDPSAFEKAEPRPLPEKSYMSFPRDLSPFASSDPVKTDAAGTNGEGNGEDARSPDAARE